MRRALLFVILAALGCEREMASMMEGGPMDGGRPDVPVGMPDGMMPDVGPVDAEPPDVEPDADPNALRVNHMQVRGTNNSYHTNTNPFDLEFRDYYHLPLAEQAGEQGIRFFDFDLDPDRRAGIALDPRVSDALDVETICGPWFWCLFDFEFWLDDNPQHALIVFFVAESYRFNTPPGLLFQLDDLEEDAVLTLGRDRILTPADVRGEHRTLREAIQQRGWPTAEQTRGKVMFVLNDHAEARMRYIESGGLDPDDRLLFLMGDPARAEAPDTGDEVIFSFEPEFDGDPWYFETDPGELERIRELVAAGYLVHGVSDDPEMVAELRAAGAHFIATRYPDEVFGGIPATGPIACNPVTRPDACDPADFEPR